MPLSPAHTAPANNFPDHTVPAGSASFYNSRAFAQNEMQFLGTYISMMEKAFSEGQDKIREAYQS